jgi:hypothetical protein
MNQVDSLSTIANGADVGDDYTSIPIQLNGVRELSIHVKFSSATLNGTLALEGSNDPTAFSSPDTADWVSVDDSSQVVSSGASHMWNILGAMYKFIRWTWVYTSGTGTATSWMDLKYLQG